MTVGTYTNASPPPAPSPEWKFYKKGTFSSGATITLASAMPEKKLWKVVILYQAAGTGNYLLWLNFNADTGANYSQQYLENTSVVNINGANGIRLSHYGTTTKGVGQFMVNGDASLKQVAMNITWMHPTGSGDNSFTEGVHTNTNALASIELVPTGGTWSGTYAIYYHADIQTA